MAFVSVSAMCVCVSLFFSFYFIVVYSFYGIKLEMSNDVSYSSLLSNIKNLFSACVKCIVHVSHFIVVAPSLLLDIGCVTCCVHIISFFIMRL